MKKILVLLLLCNISQIQYGQIIADHTVVDKYDDIPQFYINEVKKMWVSYAGESHAIGIRDGMDLLEILDPIYQVTTIESGEPTAYSTQYLRFNGATWGDFTYNDRWRHQYGEEDWWTNATAISRTKAGLTYIHNYGLELAAFGFAWCYDDSHTGSISTTVDPVYGCRWYGRSLESPSGSGNWGLDAADFSITGNAVSLDTYLSATQQYIDFCVAQGYKTKIFFSTGPVEPTYYEDEAGYQASLKHQRIRNYVLANPTRILFDYADILCYDDGSDVMATDTWNGHTFPVITVTNYGDASIGHIGEAGVIRIAKAMWWMLARIAGWDGGTSSPAGTWLGVTTDWNTASNWYGGTVPTSTTDVLIQLAAKQPVISSLTLAVCNNLTISSGASCTVNAGRALTVNGNLSNSGTLNILSNATNNSGSLIVRGSSTGAVSYIRFLRPEDNVGDRHFFSSPVGGQSVSGFTTVNSSKINFLDSKYQIWEWIEELLSDNWHILTSGSFLSGEGYNVDQRTGSDGMLGFTGAVVNSASFTATSPYVSGYTARTTQYDYGYLNPNPIWSGTRSWTNYGGGGWNLMGNPFTSAMDAAAFISTNSLKFDPYYKALYIYDGVNNVYRYVAASTPGFLEEESSGSYVQAGQGFFVIALYNNIVFNFNTGMQVHSMAVPVLKSAGSEEAWPGLQLRVKYESGESMTTIVYNNQMTAGLEPGYDVGLMSTGPDVEIYTSLVSENNNVKLTRQALPVVGGANIIIPVGLDSKKGGEVTFSANTVPFENYSFWLEDRTMGLFTDLTSNTYLTTLPANTSGSGRFFIYASTNTPSERELQPKDTPVDVWTLNGRVIINGHVSDLAFCEVFNLLGQKVMMTNLFDGELNTFNVSSVARGIYFVRVVDGQKIISKKLVLN